MTDLEKLRKRHDPDNFGEYSNENYIELFVEADAKIKDGQAREKELKEEVISWNELAIRGKPFSVDNNGCRKRIAELNKH